METPEDPMERHRRNLGMPDATEEEIEEEYRKRLNAQVITQGGVEFWILPEK